MAKVLNPVEEQVVAKSLAAAMLDGTPVTQAAKLIGIELSVARRISKSDTFKDLVSQIGNDELTPALAKAKSKLAKLTDKAIRVIEHQLDANNLEAAKIVLKAVGLDQQEEKKDQDTNITVIMPGDRSPKHVDVEVT